MDKFIWKKVYQTTDLEKFKLLIDNREIQRSIINSKKDELQKVGQLFPIVVSDNMEILDGQHRLLAAKELNIPVWYEIKEQWTHEHIRSINRSQKNWRPKDYIISGANGMWIHKDDYKQLEKLIEEFPNFNHAQIAVLAGEYPRNQRQKAMRDVKENTFQFTAVYDSVRSTLKKIKNIGWYFNGYSLTWFVDALFTAMQNPEFDLDEFIYKLSIQYGKLTKSPTLHGYLEQIQNVYNFKRRNSDRIKLV